MFGRRKRERIHIPSVELPSVELGGGRLPTIRTPELRTPEIELPRFEVPSIELGGIRLPEIHTPRLRTPELDFELLGRAPFVRRRRKNPIVQALKFVVGVGVGLVVGVVAAALVAPAAGEDTRARLRHILEGGDSAEPAALPAGGAVPVPAKPAGTGGLMGLMRNPKGRFQAAMEAAKQEREVKERELRLQFETAQRTGRNPG